MNKQEAGLLLPRSVRKILLDPISTGVAILDKPPAGTIREAALVREIFKMPKAELISCENERKIVVFDGRRFGDARVVQTSFGEMHRDIGTALNDGFEVYLVKKGTNGDSNRGELKQDACSLVLLKPVTT